MRDRVRDFRPARSAGYEARFETPGEQAQVDFARFEVEFVDEPGVKRIVWLFSMVLGYCRLIWARFVLHQDLQSVLRCHIAALEAIGGAPRTILYDRMKTAVIGEDADGLVVYNRTLVDLARHYGFQPRACQPYRAKITGDRAAKSRARGAIGVLGPRITAGSPSRPVGHARGMLVEAAWAAARAPGPLRAFFLRVRARRGQHVAAVATARKLAMLIWHLLSKGESYVWARPALHARKLRDLELKAGYQAERGQKGAAHAYNIKSHRDQERRWVEQAETAYARFVSGWNPRGPKRVRTGAATEGRR